LKIFGQDREFADGSTGKVDENYLQKSIMDPNSQVVKGYAPNQMPVFEGQLTEDEITSLVAFIKSVDGTQPMEEVVEEEEDEADTASLSPQEKGKKIYETKMCVTCHSLDGSRLVGPSFKEIYGRKGKLEGGKEYTADDEYIKRSLLEPMAEVVEGYPPGMPPYAGQLNDDDIANVIEFMKTLK
jgi:cytochrome c oxidase subunit 2